jgi:transcriptional regulator with AAA-type ATPase domain
MIPLAQTDPRYGTQGLVNAVSWLTSQPLHEDLAARSADPALRQLISNLVPAARGGGPVVICGESGVGKEYFARRLHGLRWDRDDGFVSVLASAVRADRLRSLLAGRYRLGQAPALTLFIRGVDLLAPAAQRALDDWIARTETCAAGAPLVIGGTHAPPEASFRALDLGRRPAFGTRAHVLSVPPLRSRGEDRLVLVSDILLGLSEELRRPVPTLSAQAWRRIWESPWHGNVRELINCLRQAMLVTEPRRPLTI